ncbi:Nicotinamide-nucleotide_adenylyltransferase [Hexamita inflata]|uniref:Nicotinamide-nucleotide adenylyltransferase n=1 Tax=Hexamita inflata TaxID=28002 RepID=A0AA86U4V0_9EUKA|nr:Nicotinamide-nucleotide adenylyltransferase [Hexamita inflata]
MPILVLNGSFNPITHGHIKLLEQAKYQVESNRMQVTKIYISPTCDAYPYKLLLPASHRIDMINIALQSSQIRTITEINDEEVMSPVFLPTYQVMNSLKKKHPTERIFLVCGTDYLYEIMNHWSETDIRLLFQDVELLCYNRPRGNGSIPVQNIYLKHENQFWNQFVSKIRIEDKVNIGEMSSSAAIEGRMDFLDEKVAKYMEEKIFMDEVDNNTDGLIIGGGAQGSNTWHLNTIETQQILRQQDPDRKFDSIYLREDGTGHIRLNKIAHKFDSIEQLFLKITILTREDQKNVDKIKLQQARTQIFNMLNKDEYQRKYQVYPEEQEAKLKDKVEVQQIKDQQNYKIPLVLICSAAIFFKQ